MVPVNSSLHNVALIDHTLSNVVSQQLAKGAQAVFFSQFLGYKHNLNSTFCVSRKEIEPFLPPLKPEFCVKQAMRAILTDQPMICTPRIVYMVNFMKR